jgi:hypothetical protein
MTSKSETEQPANSVPKPNTTARRVMQYKPALTIASSFLDLLQAFGIIWTVKLRRVD